MKRMINFCCVGGCENVLGTMDWDEGTPGLEIIETVGDRCPACMKEQDNPKPMQRFNNPRIGEVSVQKPSDFNDLMAKRKIENRKQSGKGPPRGGGR